MIDIWILIITLAIGFMIGNSATRAAQAKQARESQQLRDLIEERWRECDGHP
jgi:hypothetical protein